MSPFKRLYFDTNVFIALIEGENNTIADQLVELVSLQPADSPPLFCTGELTLAEALVAPLKKQQTALIRQYERTILQNDWLELIALTRPVLYHSAVIRSQYRLKLPDAIHLSAAFAAGCSHFLTRDTDFQNDYDLATEQSTFMKPMHPISVLRLNEQTLAGLMQGTAND